MRTAMSDQAATLPDDTFNKIAEVTLAF